jgi:hypothetical protein
VEEIAWSLKDTIPHQLYQKWLDIYTRNLQHFFHAMNAAELFDQVNLLLSSEQLVFIDLLHQCEIPIQTEATKSKPLVGKPGYESRLKACFLMIL